MDLSNIAAYQNLASRVPKLKMGIRVEGFKMIMVETDFSTYTWDAKNRLTEELFSMNGEFYNRMVYSYNDKNQLTEMKAFYDTAPDAIPVFSTTYFYFDNGLPKNMITIEDGFRVEHYYEYTFF